MSRALVLILPVNADGSPRLQLPGVAVEREGQMIYHHRISGETMSAKRIGTRGPSGVFAAIGTPRIMNHLSHLGTAVEVLKDAWTDGTTRTLLLALGYTEEGGDPIPLLVYSGDNARMVGRDGQQFTRQELGL